MPILGIIDSQKSGHLAALPTSLKYIGSPSLTASGGNLNIVRLGSQYVRWQVSSKVNASSNTVDYGNLFATSTDCVNWTFKSFTPTSTWDYASTFLVYTGSYYIIASAVPGQILYSTDLITWTAKTVGGSDVFQAVFWEPTNGNINVWAAGGLNWYINSANPTGSWNTTGALPNGVNISKVIYQDGYTWVGAWGYSYALYKKSGSGAGTWAFVAGSGTEAYAFIGDGNTGLICCDSAGNVKYSTNSGTSWSSQTLPSITGSQNIYSGVYDAVHNVFSLYSNNVAYTSTSFGGTWTARNVPTVAAYQTQFKGPVYYNGTITAGNNYIVQSTDGGITWTQPNTTALTTNNPNEQQGNIWAYGNNKWVTHKNNVASYVTGQTWNPYKLAYSTDKITWNTVSMSYNSGALQFVELYFFNNKFYGVENNNTGIQYSSDAITWTLKAPVGLNVRYLASNNSGQVVGNNTNDGIIFTTSNDFTSITSVNTSESFGNGVAYGAGVYVAAFWDGVNNNKLYSSSNGTTWTLRATLFTGTGNTVTALTYSPKAGFVALTGSTTYYTSTNGTSWTTRTLTNTGQSAFYTCYGDANGYIGIDNSSQQVFTSTDAVTWTSINGSTGITNQIYGSNVKEGVNPSGRASQITSNGASSYIMASGSYYTVTNG